MSDLDTLRDILGQMHVGTRHHADLDWLARNGLHVLDAALHPASEPVPATGNPEGIDVERLARALNASVGTVGWLHLTPADPVEEWRENARTIAAEYARQPKGER